MNSLVNVCRTCANTIKDEKRSRKLVGKSLQLLKLITGVVITKSDHLPGRICERCFAELDLAMKFRERCVFSQKYLLVMLKKKTKKLKPDEEKKIFADSIDEMEVETYKIDSSDTNEDPLNSNENKQRCNDEQEISEEPEVVEDSAETDHEANESTSSQNYNTEENITSMTPEQIEKYAQLNKEHQVVLEKEMKRKPKHREMFFICEACGRYFDAREKYIRHLEMRLGPKPTYKCHICGDEYSSRSILTQHSLSHNIQKNDYKCSQCGELFGDPSAMIRHGKAHANERPYSCLECTESFNNAPKLRAHMAVHRTTYKFRCEFCNKNFLTQKTLLVHNNTKEHKRNVEQMENDMEFLS